MIGSITSGGMGRGKCGSVEVAVQFFVSDIYIYILFSNKKRIGIVNSQVTSLNIFEIFDYI